ncbi:hypothetical protein KDN24_04635 [Bacillus sp. Bva_UNVM-123]|uniref:DUF6886 family protein n=1 Tax=Bacillus sp. Bva_UNVM-123 TaxID=2829798 RepID=UPI00391F8192
MLYHFSEENNIAIFNPRVSKSYSKPVIWAIDKEHALHYYFPRDCPRVIYWKTKAAREEDLAYFFRHGHANKIIVVENGWLEKIRNTKLYMYTFPSSTFQLFDKNAGYYISTDEIVPIKVEPVDDLLERILSENVELRFTPNLNPIRDQIISSTLGFSVIRFKHAKRE